MHAAFGRKGRTITGCTREGVVVWHIGEAVICELLDTTAVRRIDQGTGFELLEMD
jgi:predicted DNA-binding protein with PD1-like motif